jgi:hypothetical protein
MTKPKDSKFDWTAQLVMLRDMTKRFGTIHEAQALQLKLWPYTVDPTLTNSKCALDMESKYIEFEWSGPPVKIEKKYQTRLKTLDSNVKFLLGDDWNVKVNRNSETIFPLDTKNGKPANRRRSSSKRPNKRSVGRKARRRS